jgi:hypothetical protein
MPLPSPAVSSPCACAPISDRSEAAVLTPRLGMTHENIAMAVAEGIALGRKEGIAMAAEAIARLKGENDA